MATASTFLAATTSSRATTSVRTRTAPRPSPTRASVCSSPALPIPSAASARRRAMSSPANAASGIAIFNGATGNQIGTAGTEANPGGMRNIIAGNSAYGVYIGDPTTTNNVVAGNYIGTNFDGSAAIANHAEDIHIHYSP